MKNKIILISIFVIILILVFKNSFSILLKDNLSQKNKDFIVNNFLIFKKIERLEREISNKNKQIEIHARSVFLQGLLLNFKHLSDYFSKWTNQFNSYQEIVKDSSLSLLEYALNFALNTSELDKVLVGVDSSNQLLDIVNSSTTNLKLKEFSINDAGLLNPIYWK